MHLLVTIGGTVDLNTGLIFITFVIINSWFSFRAGEKSGKYEGMLMAFHFLKGKHALRDKIDIIGFDRWPLPLQQMFIDPNHVEIDD